MKVWRWYRARRWYWQVLLGVVAVPVALALLYVAGRSLQYAAAEKDAGLYVPSTANVVLRARDLRTHLDRIDDSLAWRVLKRKILKDPAIRTEINEFLKSSGLPTLDDLEDERKPFLQYQEMGMAIAGKDALVALQARESLEKAPACAIVRIPWLYYLAAPFARLIAPTEPVGGRTCLRLKQGKQQIYVGFEGALVLIATDRALLEQAFRRRGAQDAATRPVEGRIVFDGSPALLKLRNLFRDTGAFPYVKWETSRAVSFAADIRDAGIFFDATFEKAEPLHPEAPPLPFRAWAPPGSTGAILTNTGVKDLMTWVRDLVGVPGPKDAGRRNVLQGLDLLDKNGFSNAFLPTLGNGLTILTGIEEREGRVYPAVVLVIPSRNPKAAVEELSSMILKFGGMAKSRLHKESLGEAELSWYEWPGAVGINDFASPCFTAVKDAFLLGNNKAFTQAVVRTALQGDGLEDTANFRRFRTRLKEMGIAADPGLAGGFLYPPLLRESMDGVLKMAATLLVNLSMDSAATLAHRNETIQDLRARLGREPTEAEIVPAFEAGLDRKKEDKETVLRNNLSAMGSIRWAAFHASAGSKGISMRAVLELK